MQTMLFSFFFLFNFFWINRRPAAENTKVDFPYEMLPSAIFKMSYYANQGKDFVCH